VQKNDDNLNSNSGSKEMDLVSLLELREFIATELDPIGSHNQLDRALKPLTDGLGLDSPMISSTKPAPEAPPRSAIAPQVYEEPAPTPPPVPTAPREKVLADIISSESANEVVYSDDQLEPVPPPPLPGQATFFRRMMAGLLDEVFAISLFLIAFGVTLRTLNNGAGITLESIRSVESSILIQFAILEYSMIWLAYFTIGVGVLDSTFGMWVWGLRLNYPQERLGGVILRKGLRIVFSLLFFAPIAPVLLLAFRSKGRNLLDLLSGMTVYRTLPQ
jgi:uncharacterized RDD family membrane protein YckC